MTFVKQAGLLRSARSWGVLGLVLALAGMTGSAQGRPPEKEQLERRPHFTCDGVIKKGVAPNPLVLGQSAIVTILVGTISGPCPGGSPGNVMQDPKPNGLTFTAPPVANQLGWTCSLPGGNARCDNPSALPGGYSVTFTINATVDPTAGTSVTNCATVSTFLERNPANNKACVTIPVTP